MPFHQKIFFLLLFFLPSQLGLHFWPGWSLVMGRQVDYLSPTLYFTDLLIFSILLLWLYQHKIKLTRKRLLYCLPFLVFVTANICFSLSPMVALSKWFKIGEYCLLGWYVVDSKPNRELSFRCLFLGIFYSSVLAIWQFGLQRSVGGFFWWLGERTFDLNTPGIAKATSFINQNISLRPYATFPHPNVLSGFLVTLLPTLLFYLTKAKHKLFYLIVLWFTSITLLLTYSRIGLIIGFVLAGEYLRELNKIKFNKVYLFMGCLLLIGFILTNFKPAEESVSQRLSLVAEAWKIWRQAPILGIGLGNFVVALPEYSLDRQFFFLQPVHNIYLLLFTEIGLLGGLVCFWGLYKFLIKVWYFLRQPSPHHKEIKSIFLGLIILLVLGLIDHYPVTLPQTQILLTLLLAGLSSMLQSHHASITKKGPA